VPSSKTYLTNSALTEFLEGKRNLEAVIELPVYILYCWKAKSMNPEPAIFPGAQPFEKEDANCSDADEGTAALARSIGNAAGVSADKPKEFASNVVHSAKDAAKATFDAVSAQASELASNVADELETSGEDQKRRGAETMRAFAGAVEHAAAELDQQSPLVARQFRTAARKVDGFSRSLRDRSVRNLVNDASDLARRQPLWFFGGAIIAGFALSRFLKSSAVAPTPSAEQKEPEATATRDLRPSE
jgi:hypothetical protein